MKAFITLLFLLLTCNNYAQGEGLSIMTYNIHAIPCLKNKAPLEKLIVKLFGRECPIEGHYSQTILERVKLIQENIDQMQNQPEIIVFQEAFYSESAVFDDDFIRNLKLKNYPYKLSGPKSKHKSIWDFFEGSIFNPKLNPYGALNSGLMIFSKYPIHYKSQLSFSSCEGSDCASTKGLLTFSLTHPSVGVVNVVTTHLQAEDEFDFIRIEQINEIQQHLDGHNYYRKIFIGDFNFKIDSDKYPSYEEFNDYFFDLSNASTECLNNSKCIFDLNVDESHKQGQVWDHSFAKGFIPNHFSTPIWQHAGKPLSDHSPIILNYQLK